MPFVNDFEQLKIHFLHLSMLTVYPYIDCFRITDEKDSPHKLIKLLPNFYIDSIVVSEARLWYKIFRPYSISY